MGSRKQRYALVLNKNQSLLSYPEPDTRSKEEKTETAQSQEYRCMFTHRLMNVYFDYGFNRR